MILQTLIATSILSGTATLTDQPSPGSVNATSFLASKEMQELRVHPWQERDFYARVSTGFVRAEDSDGPGRDVEFDTGFLLSAGAGKGIFTWEHGFDFSAEIDAIHTQQDAHTNGAIKPIREIGVTALMGNAIANYRINEKFTAYGGLGVGAALLDIDTRDTAVNSFDDEDGPFLAWQAKTGVMWHFKPNMALHAGLRLLRVEDVDIRDDVGNDSFDLETEQRMLEIGLIFHL